MSLSGGFSILSLPFLYYGWKGVDFLGLSSDLSFYLRIGIGVIGIILFIMTLFAWYGELRVDDDTSLM